MKRYSLLLPLLLISALLLAACQPIQAPAAPVAPAAPTATNVPEPAATVLPADKVDVRMTLQSETITTEALAGNLLGDPADRIVNVLLPASYATSDKRYPVVYVLPWGNQNPWDNPGGFKLAMEKLLLKGEAPEMIIVVPDGAAIFGGSQFRSSPTLGDYETYLTKEVVNFVDANFRTLVTRDSRGLAGCSNGGHSTIRIGLKYPDVFSVLVPTSAGYDDSPWQSDIEEITHLTALPESLSQVLNMGFTATAWYTQAAAGVASNPERPPFYLDMPFRIVDGHGEFVPEVLEKIVNADATHLLPRYLQQPVELKAILLQNGLDDDKNITRSVHEFDALLTDSGVPHQLRDVDAGHCGWEWEADTLRFMADNLVFEQP